MARAGSACCNRAVTRSSHLLALASSLAGILLTTSGAVRAQSEATIALPTLPTLQVPHVEEPIMEVIVQALEPRYVAPTLRDRIGRIWAPVMINGKGPFRLVLDTGASRSAVLARVADSLGISQQPAAAMLVRGFTGSAIVPGLHIEQMEIGDLIINATVLPIVADVFGGAEGILGNEGMLDKRIFIDFGNDRITISRSHRDRAPRGFATIPLRITRDGLLGIDVQVGKIKAKAIVDTGAQRTVGNNALRNALVRRNYSKVSPEDIIGVTLDAQRGQNIATPPIEFNGFKIHDARVTFGDMFLFEHWKLTNEPTLLIGMDVLGLVDVLIIDYKMRELQIRPRGG